MKLTDIHSVERIDDQSCHIEFNDGRIALYTEDSLVFDGKKETIDSLCSLFPVVKADNKIKFDNIDIDSISSQDLAKLANKLKSHLK